MPISMMSKWRSNRDTIKKEMEAMENPITCFEPKGDGHTEGVANQ